MNRRLNMQRWIMVVMTMVALAAPMVVRAQIPPTALIEELEKRDEPATQPAATHIEVTVNPDEEEDVATLAEVLEDTNIGKMAQGKIRVSLKDVMQFQFWKETIQDLVMAILGFVPRIIVAIIFLFVFYFIYRGVRKLVIGGMARANVDESIRNMLSFLLKWAIMGFGVVIAGNQIGIQIAALLTGVSIIGLAVGFAAQETLSNFIAGIVIFWDRPFRVGDWVEIDSHLAQVTRVTFRSTRLTDLDNDVVVMPNTLMLSQKLVNKSANLITRVNIPVSIAYKESIDRAREVLIATTVGDSRISAHPEPEVAVRECAASSVDLMLHIWIVEERYEDAMLWEYMEKCKKALDAAGIEIPFPHTQLIIEESAAIHLLAGKRGAA